MLSLSQCKQRAIQEFSYNWPSMLCLQGKPLSSAVFCYSTLFLPLVSVIRVLPSFLVSISCNFLLEEEETGDTIEFYEGAFLNTIFKRLERMLDQVSSHAISKTILDSHTD